MWRSRWEEGKFLTELRPAGLNKRSEGIVVVGMVRFTNEFHGTVIA
jgi:hypothetical protein